MNITFENEASLEAAIIEYIENHHDCPVSGSRVDAYTQQLDIPGYGRSDIVKIVHDEHSTEVTVLELKNKPLQLEDLNQLCRYMTGLRRALHRFSVFANFVSVEGQLAGPMPDTKNVWLFQECGIEVYRMEIGFNKGVTFTQVEDWRKTDENPVAMNKVIRKHIREGRASIAAMSRLELIGGGKA